MVGKNRKEWERRHRLKIKVKTQITYEAMNLKRATLYA